MYANVGPGIFGVFLIIMLFLSQPSLSWSKMK